MVAAVAAVVVVVDQLTKRWAVAELRDREPIHLIGSLQLGLHLNKGAAFSLFDGVGAGIAPVAIAVVVGVLVLSRSVRGRFAAVVVGAVVGGAFGNLFDRLFGGHDGAVVDFIDLQWWPVFNVADMGVVCGAIGLAIVSMRDTAPPAKKPKDPASVAAEQT